MLVTFLAKSINHFKLICQSRWLSCTAFASRVQQMLPKCTCLLPAYVNLCPLSSAELHEWMRRRWLISRTASDDDNGIRAGHSIFHIPCASSRRQIAFLHSNCRVRPSYVEGIPNAITYKVAAVWSGLWLAWLIIYRAYVRGCSFDSTKHCWIILFKLSLKH